MLKEKQYTIQNEENNDPPSEQASLQEILASIRGIIEDTSPKLETVKKQDENQDIKENQITEKDDNSILELTNIFLTEDKDDSLISSNTKKSYISTIEKFTDELEKNSPANSNKTNSSESLDNIINQLMRPMLKEWLDNNLPRLVEKIVSEEIKQLMKKK